jgi:hypothetical protein
LRCAKSAINEDDEGDCAVPTLDVIIIAIEVIFVIVVVVI